MNNYQLEPWTPSAELKPLLEKNSVTPGELLEATIECFTYLLGKEEFSMPIVKQHIQKEAVCLKSPTKKGIIGLINGLEKTAGSFRDPGCIRRSKTHLLQFVSRCSEESEADNIEIYLERDIVIARNLGLERAKKMGFSKIDCNKIATTISELARNIILYANRGTLTISTIQHNGDTGISIIARDKGHGIQELDKIMSGNYKSKDGMGMGLLGSKRLMDGFNIETGDQGTTVRAYKYKRR